MVEKEVTTMVIKVDVGCEKCHKKIKYGVRSLYVAILKRSRKKICCKGAEAIKSIEMKLEKKKEEDGKKTKDKNGSKQSTDPKPVPGYLVLFCPKKCCSECYQWCGRGLCLHDHGTPALQCKKPRGRPPPSPCKRPCGRSPSLCYEPCGSKGFNSCSCGSCNCQSKGYYLC